MRPVNTPVRSQARPGTDKIAHVQTHDQWWIVTYQGLPTTVSNIDPVLNTARYGRNGWHNASMARTQARKFNRQFECEDFDVKRVI